MSIVTVGIDLAKNAFAVHGVDATGKPVLVRPSVSGAKLLELIATLQPCLIGMEACSSAHHWARELEKFGHPARLMTVPNSIRPFHPLAYPKQRFRWVRCRSEFATNSVAANARI